MLTLCALVVSVIALVACTASQLSVRRRWREIRRLRDVLIRGDLDERAHLVIGRAARAASKDWLDEAGIPYQRRS